MLREAGVRFPSVLCFPPAKKQRLLLAVALPVFSRQIYFGHRYLLARRSLLRPTHAAFDPGRCKVGSLTPSKPAEQAAAQSVSSVLRTSPFFVSEQKTPFKVRKHKRFPHVDAPQPSQQRRVDHPRRQLSGFFVAKRKVGPFPLSPVLFWL